MDSLIVPVKILCVCTLNLGIAYQITIFVKEGVILYIENIQPQTVVHQISGSVGSSRSGIITSSNTVVLQVQPLSMHPVANAQAIVLGDTF